MRVWGFVWMVVPVLAGIALFAAAAASAAAFTAPAQPLGRLTFELAALEHPAFRLSGLRLHWLPGGDAALEVARVQVGARHFERLRLSCPGMVWTAERWACQNGTLALADSGPLPLHLEWQAAARRLILTLQGEDVGRLRAVVPELAGWQLAGRFLARAALDARQITLRLEVQRGAFSDAAGERAGENITATLQATASRQKTGWQWQTTLESPEGGWYVAPWYRSGAMHLSAAGLLGASHLTVQQAQWRLDGLGTLSGSLRWQLPQAGRPGGLLQAELASGPLDLAVLSPQLIQPLLDARAGPKLTAEGTVRVQAVLDAQGVQRVDADLAGVTLAMGQHRLEGVTAHVPWRREAMSQSRIEVAGGRFGAVPLGAFQVPLTMQGTQLEIPRVDVPLLDGRLILEQVQVARRQEAWQWRLGAALEPVSMPLLSQVLGWPQMAGLLSATIPHIGYETGTLTLDGQWMVALFDGYLAIDGLKVIEPFGRLPRVQGNVEARHLDLDMLTRTFSFGDISGYIDADIHGLEMSGLQPLAFDAHVRSTPGDYRKRISQRAVQNISSLGGAGAGAAIQRSVLSIFETFGYERIGWRCRLADGVCRMGGIEEPADRLESWAARLGVPGSVAAASSPATSSQAYVLVKGGGLPSINVIGYNRRVDWAELVARLKAAIASNGRIEVR